MNTTKKLIDLFVQGVGALLSNKLLGLQPGEEQGAVGQVGQVGGLIQNDQLLPQIKVIL